MYFREEIYLLKKKKIKHQVFNSCVKYNFYVIMGLYISSHFASAGCSVIFVKLEKKLLPIDECAERNNKAVHGIAMINTRKSRRSSTNATCCHSSKRCWLWYFNNSLPNSCSLGIGNGNNHCVRIWALIWYNILSNSAA